MFAKKSRLIGAFAVILTLALAASCRGFFVNPTLTAVSVGPQNPQLTFGQQFQMSATGTYSDGTQKTLTSGVTWSATSVTPAGALSVGQSSGLVTAGTVAGSGTVSASAGSCSGCSGSTNVTVVLSGVTSITVNGGGQTIHPTSTTPAYLQAVSNVGDISQTATWTVADSGGTDQTSHFTQSFLSGSGGGEGFLPDSGVVSGTYTVKATYAGVSGTATLIVANP